MLSPPPASMDFMMDGQEVVRRQAEWEREIESLDQKEMELHQSQLRLIREQTATFLRDLAQVQQEVATMRAEQAENAENRLQYVEKVLGDSAERHTQEFASARGALDALHGRLEHHHGALQERGTHHASLEKRVDYLERFLGESADSHARELEAHRAAHSQLVNNTRSFETDHATLVERLNGVEKRMEKVVRDLAERHNGELSATRKSMEELHGRLQDHHSSLRESEANHQSSQQHIEHFKQYFKETVDRHANELEGSRAAHSKLADEGKVRDANLLQRLALLEKSHGESAEGQFRDLESVKARVDQVHSRVAEHHGHFGQHASLQERVAFLEKTLGDSADKHTEELAAAHAKLEQMRGRVSACELHGHALEHLKKSHESLHGDRQRRDAHHASMSERLDYLEKAVDEFGDKHTHKVASVSAKLDQWHGRLVSCEKLGGQHGDLQREHAGLLDERNSLHAHHGTLKERVDYLEGLLGSSLDKHVKEVEAVKVSHSKLEKESALRERNHATLEERLKYLEQLLGDSADKHSDELTSAKARMDQLHGRMAACEANSGSIEALKKAHASLANERGSRDAHHASMAERLDYLGDFLDKQGREVASMGSKVEQLGSRLATCDRNLAALADLQKSHKGLSEESSALHAHHRAVKERVDDLHGMLNDHADKHSKEFELVKSAHSRLSSEARSRDSQVAATLERLSQVENTFQGELAGHADRHTEALSAAHTKVDQLHMRLAEDRAGHESHLRSLVANERETRDAHHASLRERVDHLEALLGESADRHSQEIEGLRTMHGKHSKETKARDTHHASLVERLVNLERRVEDVDGKHTEALASAHSKFDHVHGRLAMHDKHGAAFQELHKVYAGIESDRSAMERSHATFKERIEYIESLLNDSEDKHKHHLSALEAVRSQHTQAALQARQRDASHSSAQDRLKRLEDVMEESVEKSSRQARDAESKVEKTNVRMAAHDAAIDALKRCCAGLTSEKSTREMQQATVAELMTRLTHMEKMVGESVTKQERDRHGRSSIEDLLQQEKAERTRCHETVSERVDSLQRTVHIFDGLIRKEMEERTKEGKRLWDALDNHTHDLSTQVIADGGREAPPITGSRAGSPARGRSPEHYQAGHYQAPIVSKTAVAPSTYAWGAPQASHQNSADSYVPVTVTVSGHPGVGGSSAFRVPTPQFTSMASPHPATSAFAPASVRTAGPMTPQPPGRQASPAKAMFDLLDRNNDGVISRGEWNQALAAALTGSER